MVVWTDTAVSHITEFIDNAREGTEKTAKSYMNKLVDYVTILEEMPNIGKKMDYMLFEYEIRQIIYKKHRIIYHLKNNNVVVLAILHTKLDIDSALKRLNKN